MVSRNGKWNVEAIRSCLSLHHSLWWIFVAAIGKWQLFAPFSGACHLLGQGSEISTEASALSVHYLQMHLLSTGPIVI